MDSRLTSFWPVSAFWRCQVSVYPSHAFRPQDEYPKSRRILVRMDYAGVVTTAQLIGSVTGTLKTARDLVKDVSNHELKERIGAALEGLLDLRERLLTLEEDNRQLKEALSKKAQIEGPLPPFGYFYRVGDRLYPLRPRCYQSKEPAEFYMSPAKPWNGGTTRDCRVCNLEVWEQEMK
jgi:hypothetical protein